MSGDAVFSGRDVHTYAWCAEADSPDPVMPYGVAKAMAETAVRVPTPTR
ncbi:hypothetical protein [Streptomyces sp. NPDC059247]